MGIYLNDLPPKAREQVARKMVQTATPQSRKRASSPKVNCREAAREAGLGHCTGEPHLSVGCADSSPQGEPLGKYHNVKTVRYVGDNVIHFDSQKEARRFDELVLLERAGKIRDLKLQVDFTLQEAYTAPATGNRVRAIRYKADFTYLERVRDDFGGLATPQTPDGASSPCAGEPLEWRLVVEDVKSEATRTRVYEIKKKLLMEKFGIAIREV